MGNQLVADSAVPLLAAARSLAQVAAVVPAPLAAATAVGIAVLTEVLVASAFAPHIAESTVPV